MKYFVDSFFMLILNYVNIAIDKSNINVVYYIKMLFERRIKKRFY